MKKFLSVIIGIALLTGCASFEKNAGKTLASIASSVDAGMKGWAAYVVSGKSNADQETKVKAAYNQYQLSMDIAKNAYVASVQTKDQSIYNVAVSVLVTNQQSLLSLLQSFGIAVNNQSKKG